MAYCAACMMSCSGATMLLYGLLILSFAARISDAGAATIPARHSMLGGGAQNQDRLSTLSVWAVMWAWEMGR